MQEYPNTNGKNPFISPEIRNELIEIYCSWMEDEKNEKPEPADYLLTREEKKDRKLIQEGTLLRNHPEKITHILNNPQWLKALKFLGNESPKEVIELLNLYAKDIISHNEMDALCFRIQKRETMLKDPLIKHLIAKCRKREGENITYSFIREYLEGPYTIDNLKSFLVNPRCQ